MAEDPDRVKETENQRIRTEQEIETETEMETDSETEVEIETKTGSKTGSKNRSAQCEMHRAQNETHRQQYHWQLPQQSGRGYEGPAKGQQADHEEQGPEQRIGCPRRSNQGQQKMDEKAEEYQFDRRHFHG